MLSTGEFSTGLDPDLCIALMRGYPQSLFTWVELHFGQQMTDLSCLLGVPRVDKCAGARYNGRLFLPHRP
jgi:hypothetical protein